MRFLAGFLFFWVGCGLLSAGMFNANMAQFVQDMRGSPSCTAKAAEHQSMSIVMGVVGGPASLVAVSAITGFGYDGWSLSRHDCSTRGPR